MLVQLLYLGVTLLSPRIEARLAERWFIATFPRYSNLHADDGAWKPGQGVLDTVMVSRHLNQAYDQTVASELGLERLNLEDTLTHPSSTSLHSSLASLTMLAGSVPLSNSHSSSQTHVNLEDCMPVLTAALSSSAIDAALTYTWSLVDHSQTTVIDLDTATMLIEVSRVSTALTIAPHPTCRHAT
jgi:hypothetical protein